jgi:hypothetical protein
MKKLAAQCRQTEDKQNKKNTTQYVLDTTTRKQRQRTLQKTGVNSYAFNWLYICVGRLYIQLFVGGRMSYLPYLSLLACSGV